MNSCFFLRKIAERAPGHAAIVHGGEVVDYATFYARALAIGGNLLALGLRPGDRVAFCLANSPRILETIFGCFAAGLTVVPVNLRLHAREIAYIVGNAGAQVLIHGPECQAGIQEHGEAFPAGLRRYGVAELAGATPYEALLDPAAALAEPAGVEPQAAAWLFYTSGTTGRPKGAIWTHKTIRAVIMNYLADVHSIQPDEVVIHAAPMSHGSGIVALPAVARGAANVILPGSSFQPEELFALIERTRAGHIAFLAPTQIVKMLEAFTPGAFDLSSLKAICYGGAPIYVEHLRRAVSAFGPVFAQIYGQGEAPITIAGMPPAQHQRLLEAGDERIGSTGQIRTDVEVRCVDDDDRPVPAGEAGEVVVRGDVVMPGYWNNPEATAEALRNGWLHTGDIGRFDSEGFLFLLDRAKDTIITGGNNVYPREVEEVIILHPAVAEVVVFGIPDAYWGEAVHAVVVRRPAAQAAAADIIAHCAGYLAGYKKPKAVDFVDALPVSGYGKVLRREVRARYWGERESRVGGGELLTAHANKEPVL